MDNLTLSPATAELLMAYYQDFRYDPAIFMGAMPDSPPDPAAMTARYLAKQGTTRRDFLILLDNVPIGEIGLKHIDREARSAEVTIHLQNDSVKGRGYGTRATELLIRHAFVDLGLRTLRANSVLKNRRSQHVLEKLGFRFTHEEDIFRHYILTKP